jgi:hypothetical protein
MIHETSFDRFKSYCEILCPSKQVEDLPIQTIAKLSLHKKLKASRFENDLLVSHPLMGFDIKNSFVNTLIFKKGIGNCRLEKLPAMKPWMK